jgi:hypothetical protein
MQFVLQNKLLLILVILTILGEFFHLFFEGIPFNDYSNLDDCIYYLVSRIETLSFCIVIFILIPKEHKSKRTVAFGLIGWNIKELIDEIAYLAGINNNVLLINDSTWGQLVFMLVVVFGSMFLFTKLNY